METQAFNMRNRVPQNADNGNAEQEILTMAFVNMQPLESVYDLDSAFRNGTLFPNLNKPFFGGSSK